MEIVLENGIILNDEGMMVHTLQQEIDNKLQGGKVWLADDHGDKNYLLTVDNIPVYETKVADQMYARINILWLKNNC